jgi:hypothetical protein
MAAKDVTIKCSLGNANGATLTYQVGSIPTATVSLIPPGGFTVEGFQLTDVEGQKRGGDHSISISVKAHAALGSTSREARFIGTLDGMSVNQTFGSARYEAVLKNKAQVLAELTTMTPGLYPAGVNIYQNPGWATIVNNQEEGRVEEWGMMKEAPEVFGNPPIKTYTEIIKWVLGKQKSGWQNYVGIDKDLTGGTPFDGIFTDGRYSKALDEAIRIFDTIDLSAVSGGAQKGIDCTSPFVSDALGSLFKSGPNVLLENYLGFLGFMGCTMIFSNNKAYVVPMNSSLKQGGSAPGKGQSQGSPNAAGPVDYNNYVYNDIGYRDIACVAVVIDAGPGGPSLGGPGWDTGGAAYYCEKDGASKASGVYVVRAHPFMALSATAALNDTAEFAERMDSPQDSAYKNKTSFDAAATASGNGHAKRAKFKVKDAKTKYGKALQSFAENRFYQARYGDRQGSILMDFNPQWCPGTGGVLFMKGTGMAVEFYVTSVSHHVSVNAPAEGSAITTVNFSCGRLGKPPSGMSSDSFLGYTRGKEQGIQKSFVGDT